MCEYLEIFVYFIYFIQWTEKRREKTSIKFWKIPDILSSTVCGNNIIRGVVNQKQKYAQLIGSVESVKLSDKLIKKGMLKVISCGK